MVERIPHPESHETGGHADEGHPKQIRDTPLSVVFVTPTVGSFPNQ
jgi:hypothetical protein